MYMHSVVVQFQVSPTTLFSSFNLIISISNISSIYVYQQFSLDLALYRDWSSPSCGVGITYRISKSPRHPPKGMSSLSQKTHRIHIQAMWISYQTLTFWYEYNSHIYFITHLYIVFETSIRKQLIWLLRIHMFCGWKIDMRSHRTRTEKWYI